MSGTDADPPIDGDAIAAQARRLLDLAIPPECRPGVAEAMAVLAGHAGKVLAP